MKAGNKMIESVLVQKLPGSSRRKRKNWWKRRMMQLAKSTREMFHDRRFLKKALMIACPVALQGMLNTVVNLVDTLMIGSLGATAIGSRGTGK